MYCDMSKYSGYLEVDGTYIFVKELRRKIPVFYGQDYLTHDIPHFVLIPSENYQACLMFFRKLREINYPLAYLVCDDNSAIIMAVKFVFPDVTIQLCLKHYKESIQRDLNIKSSKKYLDFYLEICSLFDERLCRFEIMQRLPDIYNKYKEDRKCLYWIQNIVDRQIELTNYHQFENAPNTNNLIEGQNSQFKLRIRKLKGFETFKNARNFINGLILKRRLSKFTDCEKPFKHLNGKTPIEQVLKGSLKPPKIF